MNELIQFLYTQLSPSATNVSAKGQVLLMGTTVCIKRLLRIRRHFQKLLISFLGPLCHSNESCQEAPEEAVRDGWTRPEQLHDARDGDEGLPPQRLWQTTVWI